MKLTRTAKIDVGATVAFVGHAKMRGAALRLGFSVKSKENRGLSVYRDGARVPMTYEILDAKRKVLATGAMSYG